MLTLKKDELYEVLEDGALQGVFPWDHSFNYDCKVPKGKMYRIRIDSLEWIASPIFGEYRKQNDKEFLMRVEKDFMKENDIRII